MKSRNLGILAVLALGAFLTLIGVCNRAFSVEAAYPANRARQAFFTKVCSRVRGVFQGAAAQAENVRLRREVDALAMLRGDVDRLEAENARLRAALSYMQKDPGRWQAAGVISTGGAAGVRKFVRVDKGSLAGVREGAVCAVPDGVVGRVTAVTPHTAEVTLVTDRSVKVACEVEGLDGEPLRGILSGGSDDRLVIRHLTGAEEVPPRSRVLTSGRGGIFPCGLVVGTLLGVRKVAHGLSREGEVMPQVDFSALEDVFIRCAK